MRKKIEDVHINSNVFFDKNDNRFSWEQTYSPRGRPAKRTATWYKKIQMDSIRRRNTNYSSNIIVINYLQRFCSLPANVISLRELENDNERGLPASNCRAVLPACSIEVNVSNVLLVVASIHQQLLQKLKLCHILF